MDETNELRIIERPDGYSFFGCWTCSRSGVDRAPTAILLRGKKPLQTACAEHCATLTDRMMREISADLCAEAVR